MITLLGEGGSRCDIGDDTISISARRGFSDFSTEAVVENLCSIVAASFRHTREEDERVLGEDEEVAEGGKEAPCSSGRLTSQILTS